MLPAPGDPLIRDDAPPGLFLSRAGTWYEDGEAVTHARLAALLSRSVARRDGRIVVTTGRDVRDVACEDAPYVARALLVDDAGARLLLSDETAEPLGDVRVDDDGVMRVAVKAGAFWAVLSRKAAHDVAALVQDDADVSSGATLAWPGGRARLVRGPARDWTLPPP